MSGPRSPVFALLCVLAAAGWPGEARAQDPFERGTWTLELTGTALSEAWNYNGTREEMSGLHSGITHALRDGMMLHAGTTLWYVTQRNADAFAMELSGGARWAIWRTKTRALSLDLAVGGSRAESAVPPGGTRFNYVFRTGATLTWRVPGGARAHAGLSWLHLSNNSLNGRDHNPDVQAIGVQSGVLLPF